MEIHDVEIPEAVSVGGEGELGAVGAEGGGDVVPVACGDAGEGQVLRRVALYKEVGVAVFFDGEEDEVAFAAVADDAGCAGDIENEFEGGIGGGGGLCGLSAAEQEGAENR